MASIEILFLSKEDIDALELSLQEIIDAIEIGLRAHGEQKVIMPSSNYSAMNQHPSIRPASRVARQGIPKSNASPTARIEGCWPTPRRGSGC